MGLTFFKAADKYLGGLDAAASTPYRSGLVGSKADELRYAIATDFTAYLTSAHAASERLKDEGDIVLIGSMSAHTLEGGTTVYAGMKAGIAGFAEALRKELGPKGVRVALVEPGKTSAMAVVKETMLRAQDTLAFTIS
jgi:NAD(P)-dependent dehydrogenase (short-subunit alcohol dehydrogenase family)